jgi:GTP cyclohydrolase I
VSPRKGGRAAAGGAPNREAAPGARRSSEPSTVPAAPDLASLQKFLRSLGIDPGRDPEYADTVERVAAFYAERTSGLRESIRPIRALRYEGHPGESIALEGIPVYGLCPHHLVPYFGEAWVRYVPRRRVCGTGSLARIVRDLARVPRLQEDLTQAVADHLERALEPASVEVRIRARHLCLEMRGVEARAEFVTEARRGTTARA